MSASAGAAGGAAPTLLSVDGCEAPNTGLVATTDGVPIEAVQNSSCASEFVIVIVLVETSPVTRSAATSAGVTSMSGGTRAMPESGTRNVASSGSFVSNTSAPAYAPRTAGA